MVALLRRSEVRFGPWWLLLGGLVLFALAWWFLGDLTNHTFFGTTIIIDTPVYYGYAEKMVDGQLPYRDFPLEYPPLALPFFLLPRFFASGGDLGGFSAAFEGLMLACGLASVVFLYITLRAVGAGQVRTALALGLGAAGVLLVGPVVLSHYDLWPAALTAAAIAAVVTRHERMGAGLIAAATVAKVYPIVLLPVLLLYVWRRQGRDEAIRVGGVAVLVGLVCLAPFVVLSPGGVWDALVRQAERPLQVESLGAALLFVWHNLAGGSVEIESSFGSQNVSGTAAAILSIVQTLLLAASLVAVWIWLVRPRDPAAGTIGPMRFVRATVASICLYVALGKVLSPQYLVWLIPVAPLIGGRRGVAVGVCATVAWILTAAYFPARYFPFIRGEDTGAATIILARDLSLVALAAVVTLPVNRIWLGTRGLFERLRAAVPLAAIRAHPGQLALLLLIGAFVLRTIWLTQPAGSLIFDETYYVNAARVIDGIHPPPGAPYADAPVGIDPNTEHPPLGKLAIAGSIRVFGDNAYGWRVPSVLAAMIALIALYGIVLAAGETAWLALLAMAIFGLDNLAFVHGRIGTLDMMALAAMLVGGWLGLRRRPGLAGIAFAVASLIRVTAVFGLLAFVLLEAIALYRRRLAGERLAVPDLRPLAAAIGCYALVGVIGLWALDVKVTAFANPIDHLRQMFGYGLNLTGGPSPSGIASNPWDWLVGSGRFDYLRVDVNSIANGATVESHPIVQFQGAISPILIGAAPIAALFGLWLAIRGRHRLAEWGVVWIAANYLPFWVMAFVLHRITYLYYVLPAIPAVAVLSAVFLLRANLPRVVAYGYLAASVLAFVAYFPFRQIPG